MEKIKEYKIVSAVEGPIFDRYVNGLISEGWQPYGSASISYGEYKTGFPPNQITQKGIYYAQAMVKY